MHLKFCITAVVVYILSNALDFYMHQLFSLSNYRHYRTDLKTHFKMCLLTAKWSYAVSDVEIVYSLRRQLMLQNENKNLLSNWLLFTDLHVTHNENVKLDLFARCASDCSSIIKVEKLVVWNQPWKCIKQQQNHLTLRGKNRKLSEFLYKCMFKSLIVVRCWS